MKQPTYAELFRVGDLVEVAQAPLDGQTGFHWLPGRVIKISTRLHVKHCSCNGKGLTSAAFGCTHGHMAYERADYNKGLIRKRSSTSLAPGGR